jgi:hypothetical protein
VAVIRGLEHEKSEKVVKDVVCPKEALRSALGMLVRENIKFKLVSTLFCC